MNHKIIVNANICHHLNMSCDDEWMLIADFSEPEEYTKLDDLFRYLTGEIPKSELPEEFRKLPQDNLKEVYEQRFPILFGNVLQEVSKELVSSEMLLNLDFDKYNVEH